MPQPPSASNEKAAPAAALACAGLLAALLPALYWPAFHYPFVNYDDPGYIGSQPRVLQGLSIENVRWAFATLEFSNWHPLTWLSYMADVSLFGADPGAMHGVNVTLHLVNALLLLWLLYSLTGQGMASGMAALWFAVHPLRVESVAWIAERKDVLSACFGLLAILGYVAYARSRSRRAYMVSLLLFACGLMAKPMLMTLPALLLLLDIWPLGRLRGETGARWRPVLLEKAPFLALSIAIAAVAYHAQASGGSVFGLERYPLAARLLNALGACAIYTWKTFAPTGLAVFYPYPESPRLLPTLGGLAVLAAAGCATGRLLRDRGHGGPLAVGFLWFVGALTPVLGIVQVGQQAYADRYTYLPGMGLCIGLAWSVAGLIERLPAARASAAWVAVALLTLTPLALLTQRQVSYWSDSERLWSRALEVTEGNYVAHASLGQHLHAQGRGEEALRHFHEALRIRPDHPQTHSNIGLVHAAAGRHAEAERAYLEAHRLVPTEPIPLLNLGSLYLATGRPGEAEAAYRRALALEALLADAHYNLGLIYSADGRLTQALEAYRRAAEISPDAPDTRRNLAMLLTRMNRPGEALEQYQHWLRLEPRAATGHNNLANALVRLGRAREALPHYQQAAALDPRYVEPLLNLGAVYLSLGDLEAARQAWEAALRVDPDNAVAASRLRDLRPSPAPPAIPGE